MLQRLRFPGPGARGSALRFPGPGARGSALRCSDSSVRGSGFVAHGRSCSVVCGSSWARDQTPVSCIGRWILVLTVLNPDPGIFDIVPYDLLIQLLVTDLCI